MSGRRSVKVVARGRVQGVGFRAYVQHKAGQFGLDGWVRNRRDGSVEALLAGSASAVDEVLAACRRGPRLSSVDDVSVEEVSETIAEGSGFRQKADA